MNQPIAEPSSTWTSRRRLLVALNCGIPDRVPINCYELDGLNTRNWYNNQPCYQALMDDIRARTDCIANWNPVACGPAIRGEQGGMLGSPHPVPVKQSDIRTGTHTRRTQIMRTPLGDIQRVLEYDSTLNTVWNVEHWCKSVEDVDRAMSVPYQPIQYDAQDYARLKGEVGDRGIVMGSLADPAYMVADLMSFQDYTLWAFEHPDHFAKCVAVVAERVMENLRRELATCTVDLYRIYGPEYMTPPYLPPTFFQRFMVPHVAEMIRIIHEAGAKVRLHCHGRIAQVLDMILEMGPDGIDPCEPPPDGDIELDQVKRRCAERGVSVWGNIELKVLEHGSASQVQQNVRRCMDQAKAGGGYVLLPTAAPINIPLSQKTQDNYRVMIDAALQYGHY